jgi:hypothetical protein
MRYAEIRVLETLKDLDKILILYRVAMFYAMTRFEKTEGYFEVNLLSCFRDTHIGRV